MSVEQRTPLSDVETRTAPALPRQYVVTKEVRATRRPRRIPRERIVPAASGVAVVALVLGALTTGPADPAAAPVTFDQASNTFPMSNADFVLEGLAVSSEAGTGEFTGTATVTYEGVHPYLAHQSFTITVFRDRQRMGTLVGSMDDIVAGRTVKVPVGSSNAFAAGDTSYTFRVGR